jgi:hypothetical protein
MDWLFKVLMALLVLMTINWLSGIGFIILFVNIMTGLQEENIHLFQNIRIQKNCLISKITEKIG